MKQAFFVTGTDTGVGKTHVTCQMIKQYIAQGKKVVGMKPIAAGEDLVNGEWVNDDVLKLAAASNVNAPRHLINPYSFRPPIAPHIAAEQADITVDCDVIKHAFETLKTLADVVIVEGAGGFLVPINNTQTMADLAVALNVPVIMLVGMRLGCINHSLLTVEAIRSRQLHLHGWVANQIDPNMLVPIENEATLTRLINAPKLMTVPYFQSK